jgi:hypothetical protein
MGGGDVSAKKHAEKHAEKKPSVVEVSNIRHFAELR